MRCIYNIYIDYVNRDIISIKDEEYISIVYEISI